ncbi:MAG: multidrug transporter [Gammaproteobacteria bacterium]
MNRVSKRSDLGRALVLAVGVTLSPVSAVAEEGAGDPWYGGEPQQYGERGHSTYAKPAHDADYMAADGLIARPLGIASTIIGTGLFIVTLPFSLIGGNVDEAGQVLVQEPATYTFGRCLGCF